MSYRYMRIILFFDLPSVTYNDQKEYSKFHKFLIKNGYIMMQESVYAKLALSEKEKLKKNKPAKGLVQILVITEKQFSRMEYIIGNKKTDVVDTESRLIIL